MSGNGWSLHPQLRNDTADVGDLPLSRVLVMNEADYRWLILVPRRAGVGDMIDLGAEQAILMNEISLVSHALKDETQCDKLNVAAIGNIVPQLHIHIVAHSKYDPLWPKPVWGATSGRRYEAAALQRFVSAMCQRLGLIDRSARAP